MGRLGNKISAIKDLITTDTNLRRAGRGIIRGWKALPSATGQYLVRRVPIVQWLPNYSPQWLVNDLIAGVTNGVILIPQALGFAVIAGVSLQSGLIAIVLPQAIYAFMGTSKDMSIGPTSTTAILSRVIIPTFAKHGVPALITIPAVSVATGSLSLVFGLLNLGFLIDSLSVPIIHGFLLGVALVVIQAQVPLLLGEPGVSDLSFITQGMAIVNKIGTSNPLAIAIGFSSVAFLFLVQFVGKKWGDKFTLVRIMSQASSLVVLIAFTLISFFINKDLKQAVWLVVGVVPEGLPAPKLPSFSLLQNVILISIPLFLSTGLEHLALAKGFAMRNNYEIDTSQELVSLGIANIASGLMGGMPVGSNIARTSVLEVSGVKSPLSGVFTALFIILAITKLNTILFYMPLAVLGAVLLVAVIECQPPQAILGKYWKISFIDFAATIFTFNVTLIATPEMGIGSAVIFLFIYTFLRLMFSYAKVITVMDLENQYGMDPLAGVYGNMIPMGTQAFTMGGSVMFMNAYRQKRCIMDTIQTLHSGNSVPIRSRDRVWSDLTAKHITRLRRKANVITPERFIPHIRLLILDFTHTTFVDSTGIQMLEDLKKDLIAWGGDDIEFRFVGLSAAVRERLQRANWKLASYDEALSGLDPGFDVYFELLKPALEGRGLWRPEEKLDFGFDTGNIMTRSDDGYDEYETKKGVIITTNVFTKNGKAYKRSTD
ncbi:hypothetical protein BP5796_09420 [Coleophoma crateriformis]|uniref:STAS domain-containing protein n=1 Tax=Coleophoma crateriformis TaxID=565419 RepID=A0A3D8QYB9_9HELO|nr:hypothetical protein BP5796_09420 [Coleophoma crateriformis]